MLGEIPIRWIGFIGVNCSLVQAVDRPIPPFRGVVPKTPKWSAPVGRRLWRLPARRRRLQPIAESRPDIFFHISFFALAPHRLAVPTVCVWLINACRDFSSAAAVIQFTFYAKQNAPISAGVDFNVSAFRSYANLERFWLTMCLDNLIEFFNVQT